MSRIFPEKEDETMEFGMPTLLELSSLPVNCILAHRLGLHFVELNMNLPYCTLEALQNQNLKKLAENHHLFFTLHADENLYVCDFNPRVAAAHLDTMLGTIDLCRENRIPLINFHMSPGVYFTLPDGKQYLFDQYREHYFHCLSRFRNACEKAASGQVMLCIENTGLGQGFIRDGMEFLLESPAFQLTWDIGHDYSAGTIDRPFILSHLSRVHHMHIHGATGKQHHLPLDEGDLDWQETLFIGRPRRAVIEVKTASALERSVAFLHSRTGGA